MGRHQPSRPRAPARRPAHRELRLDRGGRRPTGINRLARDVDENVIGTKRSATLKRRATPSPEALGPTIAYLAVKDGTPVYDRDGTRVGVVEHVMDEGGIFEGLIVHTYPLPGRHLYADANQVGEIHERGVLLSVVGADLHDPRRESGRRRRDGRENTLEARLRRALDWISARF